MNHVKSPDTKRQFSGHTLLLHPDDTVLVAIVAIVPGDDLLIDGVWVSAPDAVQVGHKLARRALATGDQVIKYGAPIGSVIRPVAAGAHVHSHNMKSDYIPSHSRQNARGNRSHD